MKYFQSNRIHHGKRSGVVVLGSGRGQIRNNEIYQNKEAGLYILYRGNPTVRYLRNSYKLLMHLKAGNTQIPVIKPLIKRLKSFHQYTSSFASY